MNNCTSIHLKGALEPLYLNEPLIATMNNMNAGIRNQMIFFQGEDMEGRTCIVSITNVLYMRDERDDV